MIDKKQAITLKTVGEEKPYLRFGCPGQYQKRDAPWSELGIGCGMTCDLRSECYKATHGISKIEFEEPLVYVTENGVTKAKVKECCQNQKYKAESKLMLQKEELDSGETIEEPSKPIPDDGSDLGSSMTQ